MSSLSVRQWHAYLGAFIAPSVLFFALTGSLQLFNLHEAHGTYHPAAIIEKLGRLHKDQVFLPEQDRAPLTINTQAGPETGTPAPGDDDQPLVSTLLLKGFFLFVALALALSTALGVWIGLNRQRGKSAMIALLASGTAVPIILLVV